MGEEEGRKEGRGKREEGRVGEEEGRTEERGKREGWEKGGETRVVCICSAAARPLAKTGEACKRAPNSPLL